MTDQTRPAAQTSEPRTAAGRRLIEMLPDYSFGAATNRWQEHLQKYVGQVRAIEAEAAAPWKARFHASQQARSRQAAALPATPGLDVERLRAVVKAAYLFVRYRAGEVRIYDEYWYDLTDALREIPLSIYGDATPESAAAYAEGESND